MPEVVSVKSGGDLGSRGQLECSSTVHVCVSTPQAQAGAISYSPVGPLSI